MVSIHLTDFFCCASFITQERKPATLAWYPHTLELGCKGVNYEYIVGIPFHFMVAEAASDAAPSCYTTRWKFRLASSRWFDLELYP